MNINITTGDGKTTIAITQGGETISITLQAGQSAAIDRAGQPAARKADK